MCTFGLACGQFGLQKYEFPAEIKSNAWKRCTELWALAIVGVKKNSKKVCMVVSW